MNWKNEAIERLSRYTAMTQAMENIPLELVRLKQDAVKLRGCRPDRIPGGGTPGPGDDALLGNLVKREELNVAYKNAKLWVATTEKALSVLTDEERTILTRMYVTPEKGVVNALCEALGLEQSSIYRKRDQALYRFTIALYGAA